MKKCDFGLHGCVTGLLAGMWELPSMLLEADVSENKYKGLICDMMQKLLEKSLDANSVQFVGEVCVFPKTYHLGFRIIQIYAIFDLHLR